ncbi:MAG: hypothetical protein O2894_07680, partial [Planctomycetota bacterium]|nr:hypothetical protein [Planctomycetota bacterium]
MMAATELQPETADARPWRKRHPVLSRALLYVLGLGLAGLLYVRWQDRRAEDEATRIHTIQLQVDGLGLVLATDPEADRLLSLLDEKYAGTDLPAVTQGRVQRWRAAGWRRKYEIAADDAARDAARARVDAAFEAAAALDLPPTERTALALERAETLLARLDLKEARHQLGVAGVWQDPVQGLMATMLDAQALRLEGQPEAALEALRKALAGLPATPPTPSYLGGRAWTVAQVAVEMLGFLTREGAQAADAPLWSRLRGLAPDDFEVQSAAA